MKRFTAGRLLFFLVDESFPYSIVFCKSFLLPSIIMQLALYYEDVANMQAKFLQALVSLPLLPNGVPESTKADSSKRKNRLLCNALYILHLGHSHGYNDNRDAVASLQK